MGFFNKKTDLIAAAVKRYFRLMPVVLGSVLLAYALLTLGLFYTHDAGLLAHSPYLGQFWLNPQVSLLDALREGLFGVFAILSTEKSLDPVLWTLFYELSGSFIVFSLLALLGKDRRRWYVYPFLVISFLSTWYIGFIVGLILADLYSNRQNVFKRIVNLPAIYKISSLLLALYMASMPYTRTFATISPIYKPLQFTDQYSFNVGIVYLFSAIIIVVLLLTSRRLSGLFKLRPLVFLGKISYSLYATHLIVLCSIAAYAFLKLYGKYSYNQTIAIVGVIYIVASISTAWLFQKYIDKPSIQLSQKIARKAEQLK